MAEDVSRKVADGSGPKRVAFVSDLHFGDERPQRDGTTRGVIHFERRQFKTIKEHDDHVFKSLVDWGRTHKGWTLYILGDFGDTRQTRRLIEALHRSDVFVVGLAGNHDVNKPEKVRALRAAFDEWHDYPFYVSKRVLLSHEPQYPLPAGVINVHGHLHGAHLIDPKFINVSINEISYVPLSWKDVERVLNRVAPPKYKFLQEPYRDLYWLTMPNDDAVGVDGPTGVIDLRKSVEKYNLNHPDRPIEMSEVLPA